MEQIYASIIVAAASFLVGIICGGLIMFFWVGKKKKEKTIINDTRDQEIISLNNEVKWLEEALQNIMDLDQYNYFQNLTNQIKEKDKAIKLWNTINKNWIEMNQKLSDEILSLEEDNKIKYNAGFINGRLDAIRGMNIKVDLSDMKIIGKPITGHEMIQDSAVIVNKAVAA